MSKLVTTLPIDVSPVLAALPKGHFLHSVTMKPDGKSIEVIWEHDDIKTGRTYPVEHHLRELERGLDKTVNDKGKFMESVLWPRQWGKPFPKGT